MSFSSNAFPVPLVSRNVISKGQSRFYLAYSEAGFRGDYLNVWQFGLVKPAPSPT